MTNMAMNAAAVYGMCCGIFLSFCMKDPFAGRATCSDSSGLTFIYLSLFYYSLYTYLYNPDRKPSIVSANFDCRLSVRSRTSLFAGEKSSSPSPLASVFFAASLFLDWPPILGQKNKQPSGTGLYQRENKKSNLKLKYYDIQRIYERERLHGTDNLLGRFHNSRPVWAFGYPGHIQPCFQGVE